MRVGWVSLVWLVCLVGCDDLEPEGTYSGLVSGSTQISTLLSGPDEDGNLNARAQNANVSRSDVNVTVRRTGDSRLEITLDDGCVVPFEQQPEPNEHNTRVPGTETVVCNVEVDGYSGPIEVSGSAMFGRDDPSINLMLYGSVPAPPDPDAVGATSGSWSYTFNGTRHE
ncbi:MAG: hypothetical protein H6719_14670 [Sandaracinaceae bacterium]|nr:hypothetical protein [Sandaracinaceae bacterium]